VTETSREGAGAAREGRAEAWAKTIAVLPFRTLLPSDEHKYLGLGMADVLITRLSNIRQLTVRPTSAVVRYDNLEQDPVAAGLELGVETVLEATVRGLGERTRVTVQLIDIRVKAPLWAEKFDENVTDLFALEDAIAERLARALALRVSEGETRLLRKRSTENIEAYHAYLRGRYYWNKQTAEGVQRAAEHFEQAIALDSEYALAYAGLADAYNLIGTWGAAPPPLVMPRAKALAALTLLHELKEQARVRYVTPYDVAGVYAGLGEKEQALYWLGKAVEEHSGSLVWLKVDNTFGSLRDDPLFRDILRRMHLKGYD
jgi:TolB-like protein